MADREQRRWSFVKEWPFVTRTTRHARVPGPPPSDSIKTPDDEYVELDLDEIRQRLHAVQTMLDAEQAAGWHRRRGEPG